MSARARARLRERRDRDAAADLREARVRQAVVLWPAWTVGIVGEALSQVLWPSPTFETVGEARIFGDRGDESVEVAPFRRRLRPQTIGFFASFCRFFSPKQSLIQPPFQPHL